MGVKSIVAVVVLVLALIVASCQPAPTPEVVEPTEEVAEEVEVEPSPEPLTPGGDLVIVMDGNIEPANPDPQVHGIVETQMIATLVADSLVCQDPETHEYRPWLAESWELSPDYLTWTFDLREDVRFQDGTAFNAEAVKANLDRMLAPETQSVESAARLGPVDSIEVVDEYTVKVTHERPYVQFLEAFAFMNAPMWSPTAFEEYGLDEFAEHLVGSGPFIFDEWAPGSHMTFVRNPDYNSVPACVDHTGPALADSLTVQWVAEPGVRGRMVEVGDAHIAYIPPEYAARYLESPDHDLVSGYNPGSGMQWVMNTLRFPLDDVQVRRALVHAIDKEAIAEVLYDGQLIVSYSSCTPISPCCWHDGAKEMYPYDPDRANTLLDEAGWELTDAGIREKDGERLEISLMAISGFMDLAEAMEPFLRAVGVRAQLETVPWTVQYERAIAGDFGIVFERMRNVDPQHLMIMYHSEERGPGGWAWTGFADEELDELIEEGASIFDLEERCEYYVEAQKIIMENALTLGGWGQPVMYAVDGRVQGFGLGQIPVLWLPYQLSLAQ